MEEALVQSAMAEIAMWDAFAAGRSANATGFLAIVLASVNIFGGFVVSHRMLSMFKKKEKKKDKWQKI